MMEIQQRIAKTASFIHSPLRNSVLNTAHTQNRVAVHSESLNDDGIDTTSSGSSSNNENDSNGIENDQSAKKLESQLNQVAMTPHTENSGGINLKRTPLQAVVDNNDNSMSGKNIHPQNSNLVTVRRGKGTKRVKLSTTSGMEKSNDVEISIPNNNDKQNNSTMSAEEANWISRDVTSLANNNSNEQITANHETQQNFDLSSLYPQNVACLSSGLLKALYEDAMKVEEEEMEKSNRNSEKEITEYDQTYLNEAEILSFEMVLLPAIAYEEEQAIKKVQARVQRDFPEFASEFARCRKFVYSSIIAATHAVKRSRLERTKVNKLREERWAQEKAQKLAEEERRRQETEARKKDEQARIRELQRLKKLRALKKVFPQNQETWKEVAFLMKERSHLQNDEGKWKQGLELLERRKKELEEQEKDVKQQQEQKRLEQQKINVMNNGDDVKRSTKPLAEVDDILKLTQCIEDIILSSTRIEQGLQVMNESIQESEMIRKDLYEEYTRHHQFHGYQGISNPKGLLKALSQSQDDSEW